jgi:hypothetical protein
MFAVIVTGTEARSGSIGNPVVGAEGDKYWVLVEPEGWVEATSGRMRDPDKVPIDVKTWSTREAAEKFAKRWKGHPWWCKPKGYEVVEFEPTFKPVRSGFKRIEPETTSVDEQDGSRNPGSS